MDSIAIAVFCMILLLISLLYSKIRYPFVKQMNEIPGPNGMPLLGAANLVRHIPRNKRMEQVQEWFKSYGPIFRTWIGPVCIVHIGKAEYAQKILSSMVNTRKPIQYTFAKLWLGDCVTLAGENWFERRNLLTPAFHASFLNGFFDTMVKNCQILMKRLDKEADSDEFDIYPYVNDCTIDIIAETAMNVKLNVQNGLCTEYPKNIHKVSYLLFKRILNPLVYLDFIYALTKDYKKLMKVITELHDVSSNVLEKRYAERKANKNYSLENAETKSLDHHEHKTVLDYLLDLFDEKKYPITLEEIREEIDDIMFAGFDPVKFAISMTIYLIGLHPEIQEKIHAELDSVISSEDSLNAQTLRELRYLDCAMKECMRLYPPAPFVARSLKEAVVLGNHTIPVGTTVAIHFHAIHRSPEYFANPDKFDPSHFSPEREKDLHPFAFIPFSAGPRNCMGHKFAKVEIKIALALFFKKYEVKSVTPLEDMTVFTEIILKPENGIMVKIKRRS